MILYKKLNKQKGSMRKIAQAKWNLVAGVEVGGDVKVG
jgi:hypothetical protein